MKKGVCIAIAALAIGLTAAFSYGKYKKSTSEQVKDDFKTCLETKIGHEFEVTSVKYSLKADIYIGAAIDLNTNEKYNVYYVDETKDAKNVGFENCNTGASYRPVDENQRLNSEKAEKLFNENLASFTICKDFLEDNPAIKRVNLGNNNAYSEWTKSWNDTNVYKFQREFNNVVFELDDENAFVLIDKMEFCKAIASLHSSIAINSSKLSEGIIDFLLYVENTGYSLHLVYDQNNVLDRTFPHMSVEKNLGDGWYIAVINKEIIE